MKTLFSGKLMIDGFESLKDKVKCYVKQNLNKQHMETVKSLATYQSYKTSVQSLTDVPYYKLTDSEYKYSHCLSVAQNCIKLSQIEGNVCSQLLELAGLLHDVGHFNGNYKKHGIISAKMAVEFLTEESSLDEEQINGISKIIKAHYPEKLDKRYYYSADISLEEILLLEADFLDKLNPRRGMMIFLECGSNRESIEESIEQYERKIIKRAYDILTMPVEKRECHYTDSFLQLLREQLEVNKKILKYIRIKT